MYTSPLGWLREPMSFLDPLEGTETIAHYASIA
jgi:hypothetical protein